MLHRLFTSAVLAVAAAPALALLAAASPPGDAGTPQAHFEARADTPPIEAAADQDATPEYAPDLDGSGEADLLDFLAFSQAFSAGEESADCDGSGSLDLFDYLCFFNSRGGTQGKPPKDPPAPLTWTTEVMGAYGGTWEAYTAAAAAHVGPGTDGLSHDDWRLPTVEELQAAVADGSWGNSGPDFLNYPGLLCWTSKVQGTWAYAVTVTTDGNGDVVPDQSGVAKKVLKGSNLRAKYVRP